MRIAAVYRTPRAGATRTAPHMEDPKRSARCAEISPPMLSPIKKNGTSCEKCAGGSYDHQIRVKYRRNSIKSA